MIPWYLLTELWFKDFIFCEGILWLDITVEMLSLNE